MFARTVLDRRAVEQMRDNPALGRMFVRELERSAVLLLSDSDKAALKELLPMVLWKAVEDGLVKRRLLYRDWSPQQRESGVPPVPDVIVTGSAVEVGDSAATVTDMESYWECAPVRIRRELENRERPVGGLEEFWTQMLEPVLDSPPTGAREIDIIDRYLIQDADRQAENARGTRGSPSIVWLLAKLDDYALRSGTRLRVRITTTENPDKQGYPIRAKPALSRLLGTSQLPNLDVRFWIVSSSQKSSLPFKSRRLLVNRCRGFKFDKGVADLVPDLVAATWTWLRNITDVEINVLTMINRATHPLVPDDADHRFSLDDLR